MTGCENCDALAKRLLAFSADCVMHGDMTPDAERMLARILTEATTPATGG